MKSISIVMAAFALVGSAHAAKPCEELKATISTKLEGKGVKGYSLEIVPADKSVEGRVVGTCDLGKNKIVYKKK